MNHPSQCLSESSDFLLPDHPLEDFVWPEDRRPNIAHNHFAHDEHFPEVDLQPLTCGDGESRRQLIHKVSSAALDWGFFRVVNHGVPSMLIEKMLSHIQRFFLLPLEEKTRVTRSSVLPSGYGGSSQNASIQAWQESLHVMWGAKRIENLVQKIWPNEETLGSQICADLEQYTSLMGRLANQILELLFIGLQVDPSKAMQKFGPESNSTLRINYYPICPQPNLTFGSPPHTDFGALTILCQDDVGGLQVFKDGEWVGIKPKKESLIVNVGDIVQVLSNWRYKSVLHRSVVNCLQPRVSFAFHYNPLEDSFIGPLPELITPEYPAKYKMFTWEEYRLTFTKAQRAKHSPCLFFQTL